MALTQDPQSFITDPLAMRFMTGEQMGYMPQAQFLTPSEYGAFRTVPGPQGHSYLHQDPGFLQSWLIRNRGGVFGLPAYTFNTYNPAVNPQQYMYSMRTRSIDSTMAMAGTMFDMMPGMLAGMALGGVPGLAAGMLMPSVSKPFLDRVRDMRGIQNMSMSKIVGGMDVNQATGAGFNAQSARSIDSFLRIQGSGDALLKQGDWRKLLQMGIEHGQFDYAGNADQYKDALKKLRKSITTVMEVAGSTDFKDIMKEYKRMQTMGADLSQYTNIMRKEDLYGRIAGMSHDSMVDTFGQQGALIYQQAGLTGYQGSLQAMHNAASVTLMQQAGLLSPGALSRYGGVSGMAQAMTQQDATAQNRIADFMLPYFMKDDASGLDDSAKLSDLLNSNDPLGMLARAAGSKTRTLEQRMRYDHNRGDLMQKFQEKYGQETPMAALALKIGNQVRLKGVEALEYGYRQMGFDQNIAHLKAKQFTSEDFRNQEERELQLARRKMREEWEVANSPFRKLALSLDKTFTRWGENIFGGMTNWYSNWSQRNAENAEGNFRVGGGMAHSQPWQGQVNAETTLPPKSATPKPHPVENLAELAEPAARAFSGNNSGKVSWTQKDGAKFGLFGMKAENMSSFTEWAAKQGPKGAYWAEEIKKAGGFEQKFESQEALENSDIGKLMARLSEDEDFAKKQREFIKEKFYDPSLAAMDPAKKAEILASKAGQQALFIEAAKGEAITEGESTVPYLTVPEAHKKKHPKSTRNLSVYNVGNVKLSPSQFKKLGLSGTWDKETFAAYADLHSGLVASGERILNYANNVRTFQFKEENGNLVTRKKKAETLHEFASIYAPWDDDNNPTEYAQFLADTIKEASGKNIGINQKINFSDAETLSLMMRAIPKIEHGPFVYNRITPEEARNAASDVLAGKKPVPIGRAPKSSEAYTVPQFTKSGPQINSPAASILSEAMRAGNGRVIQEVIKRVIDRRRKENQNNPGQLAILDEVEKQLNANLNADNAQRSEEEQRDDAHRAVIEQIQKETRGVGDDVYKSLFHERQAAREGKRGHAGSQRESPQLMQNLNRYDSGVDMRGGELDSDAVAKSLSEIIGKDINPFKLRRLIEDKSGYNVLNNIVNEYSSIEHAKSILGDKGLGLSDEEVKKAASDPVARAILYSAGMATLPEAKAKEIRDSHVGEANKYAEGERHNQQTRNQRFYEKYTSESFAQAMPGIDDLGGDYKAAREYLFKRAFDGEKSTPFIINVARLSLLKNLSSSGGEAGDAYRKQFALEAKKLGFSDEWITERIKSSNDLSAEDMAQSPLLKELSKEDFYNIQQIKKGLLHEGENYAAKRKEDVIDKYNANLITPNGLLLKSQAVLVKGMNIDAVMSFADRIGMDRDKLLTVAGITEMRRRVIEGKIGSEVDRKIAEKVWKRYQDEGRIDESDFLLSSVRRNMADSTTYTALNHLLPGEEVWGRAQQQERERQAGQPTPEPQNANQAGGPQGPGTPLSDETVKKLDKTIDSLIEVLKKLEHRIK